MMNRSWRCLVLLVWLSFFEQTAYAAPPNILLLFPDQWRWDWDGLTPKNPMGELPLHTPFMEQARANGMRFDHAYVPSPVCAPSRACLTSGKEFDHAGVPSNKYDFPLRTTSIYKLLRDGAGYHTMTCGKDDLTKASAMGYNLGFHKEAADGTYRQAELGFSDGLRVGGKMDVMEKYPIAWDPFGIRMNKTVVTTDNGTVTNGFEVLRACSRLNNSQGPDPNSICDSSSYTSAIYEDNQIATDAKTLLSRKPSGKPWFLQVNFAGPHPPFVVTGKMAASVANRTWPAPVNGTCVICPQQGGSQPFPPTEPFGGGRCNYGSEIENLDKLFSDIVAYVRDDLNELDNTIVCISSDHGTMLGDHGDRPVLKSMPWQGSASVPLLCFGPGIASNVTYNAPVATLDLAGTFLDYANVQPATGMTTRSLRALLESGGRSAPARSFVSSGLNQWRMVVDVETSLKLVCCNQTCLGAPYNVPPPVDGWITVLYDTDADPYDMNPIQDEYPDIVKRLKTLLPTGWCE